MKPKFRVTVDNKTSIVVEAWNGSAAAMKALREDICCKQNMRVGDKTTIEIERVA